MADLLEISAPSIDTLENDGGDEEEGEEDQDEDRKREMKGIRRTVLRVSFVCRLLIVDFIYHRLLVFLLGWGSVGDDNLSFITVIIPELVSAPVMVNLYPIYD